MNKNDELTMKIGDTDIKNNEYEKLLGVKVDTKLNFNEHLDDKSVKSAATLCSVKSSALYDFI